MVFAYKYDQRHSIEIYCSTTGKLPPEGFLVCTFEKFVEYWRIRDIYAFARMYGLVNPYQGVV
jgi:hypothetical protein